ncbi:MAG: YceI family protein [Streptosporangiaceae bacterium]|nr:YceI family protein [Streptosporangiaceae bacterium]
MTESVSTALLGRAAGTWQLDPQSTTIEIHTKAVWGLAKVRGTFRAVSGSVVVGDQGVISGEVVVDAQSIDTGNKRRDKHLRSADFFEVSKYPTFTFTASEATPSPDGTLNIKGTLLIKGQVRPIELVASYTNPSPDRVALSAETTIDRSKWGMSWKKGASFMNRVVVVAKFVRS